MNPRTLWACPPSLSHVPFCCSVSEHLPKLLPPARTAFPTLSLQQLALSSPVLLPGLLLSQALRTTLGPSRCFSEILQHARDQNPGLPVSRHISPDSKPSPSTCISELRGFSQFVSTP